MIKFIKSNWREALALAIVVPILLLAILALGSKDVSESGPLSAALSLLTTLIGGAVKFVVCLALTWFGLMVTLPEGAKFVFDHRFDTFWLHCTDHEKARIALLAAGILALVAGLCMASA